MTTVKFTGTVSEGTMRPQDVLPAMMDVLKQYHPKEYQEVVGTISDEFGLTYTELCGHENHPAWQDETMAWILYEVAWDAMNDIAPDGYYFGANPGDGADYGYWLDDDWKEEEDDFCYCCGRGNRTLTPCPKCGEMLCEDCTPPFGPHVCDLD